MKTENKRRSRIIRLVLLMAVLAASQTIGFETSWKLQTVNATLSSSSAFQYIVTILMENNGLCDVTPSVVYGCSSSSIPVPLNPRSQLEPSKSNFERCFSHSDDRVLRNLASTNALSQLHLQSILSPDRTDRFVHQLSFRRKPSLQLFLEPR